MLEIWSVDMIKKLKGSIRLLVDVCLLKRFIIVDIEAGYIHSSLFDSLFDPLVAEISLFSKVAIINPIQTGSVGDVAVSVAMRRTEDGRQSVYPLLPLPWPRLCMDRPVYSSFVYQGQVNKVPKLFRDELLPSRYHCFFPGPGEARELFVKQMRGY